MPNRSDVTVGSRGRTSGRWLPISLPGTRYSVDGGDSGGDGDHGLERDAPERRSIIEHSRALDARLNVLPYHT